MCPDDGYVCFQDSELISACWTSRWSAAAQSRRSSPRCCATTASAEASALAMGRLAKLTARFLTDHGFSIGIRT